MRRRLPALRDAIESALSHPVRGLPTLVVMEDLPTHAKSAGLTGQVQGIARELCTRYAIPFATVPAATLKVFATNSGKADKRDMWLALPSAALQEAMPVKQDGEVDAWWLRQMGLALLGEWGVSSGDRRALCLTKVRRYYADGREDKS